MVLSRTLLRRAAAAILLFGCLSVYLTVGRSSFAIEPKSLEIALSASDKSNLVTAKPEAGAEFSSALVSRQQGTTETPLAASQSLESATTEIILEKVDVDGIRYNQSTLTSGASGGPFLSDVAWKGKCWYEATNFCVVKGQLTMFHDPKTDSSARKHSLRMCNEFSQHSPLIRLSYVSAPMPETLPGPLYTTTKGWVLQFWCQDLFHMTLSLMPAFHTTFAVGPHPDVYVRIAKGRRSKGGYCRIKFGDPSSWERVRNSKWGGDHQFPFAGNPYWPFYQLITPDPYRVYPLYAGATQKTACYQRGVIDKVYLKNLVGEQARNYSNSMLSALSVTKGPPRRCGKYRLTLIDRRGRTRVLTNIPDLVQIAKDKGFEAQSVALEKLPIRDQLALITSTDVLMGMHGNGITWLQFLPPGSAVLELIGVWYTPYALLWGHKHFHSSMKNNMAFKKGGEFKPFAHNESEVALLLDQVKAHLDSTSCSETPFVPPNEKLENLYKSCTPHC